MGNQEPLTNDKIKLNTAAKGNALIDAVKFSASQCVFDERITFLYANSCFYDSLGYTKEEYISLFPDFCQYYRNCPEEFQKLKEAVTSAVNNSRETFTADCRMPLKDGSFTRVHMNGSMTGEQVNGYPVFFIFYSDIHELIQEKEEKTIYFEWMMKEYMGNIYISDVDTYELLYVNDTSCKTLKASRSNIIGKLCYEVIQGRTSPCPFCTNKRLRTDKSYEWEYFNPILGRIFMIKNRLINWNGHRARIELSHDMYSVEYKLAKKDKELDALLKSIPGGFARLDARDFSTILWYGADFLDIIGYTPEQFKYELNSQCTYIHPDDLERVQNTLAESKATGQGAVIESRFITRSGKIKIMTITLCYANEEASWDGIPSFYSVGIDITKDREEQARQQKALKDAYLSVRVASAAKTDFLSSMSHDIRTPMNAIMGMTEIAQANITFPDKVSDCLEKIKVSGKHLLGLINEVLDMSTIESGKIELSSEIVMLPDLIQNITVICKPLLEEKQLQFQTFIGQLKHEKIISDGERLHQVFLNLLSNAIKYTPEGGEISLSINEHESFSKKKSWFEFVFTDNGIGMSDEFIPHIFEPFSRAEDSRISKIQGTGLGMAITENIVRMMNGSIDVKSQIGLGSQFTVSVEFDLADDDEFSKHELVGLPVLVLDSDPAVCENCTTILEELNMPGTWVTSDAEALSHILKASREKKEFFAVIVGYELPDINRLETVKALRECIEDKIPIIILSSHDDRETEEQFLYAGANAFITKPLFKSKLLHILQLFCTNKVNQAKDNDRFHLSGKRVLLVEDNELNREIAVELLKIHGMIIETAENGEEAVHKFASSSPGHFDVILMDIQMPIMNGYDASLAIRHMSRKDAQLIPILALTANAFTNDIGDALSAGMNDHITKPIDIQGLIKTLKKWIR